MKRLLLIVFCLIAMAGQCFGADATSVVTSDTYIRGPEGGTAQRLVLVTMTCATSAATFSDLTFTITRRAGTTAWSDGTSSGTIATLEGWYLYQIEINPGATGPTDDSDLYIWKPESDAHDILQGNGVNQIDNTAHRIVWASDGVTSILGPITDSFVVDIDNNAVNNASVAITFVFVPKM